MLLLSQTIALFKPSVDAAVTVHGMDVFVELTRPILFQTEFGISSIHGGQMDLQRVTAVSAHAVVHSHLTHRDMGNVLMMSGTSLTMRSKHWNHK
ncbi:MAG: hypothetical protein ACI8SJ_001578 [Shewanella sp.]|jgi:hypothetical protein